MKKINDTLFEIRRIELNNELQTPLMGYMTNRLWGDTSSGVFDVLYDLKWGVLRVKIN